LPYYYWVETQQHNDAALLHRGLCSDATLLSRNDCPDTSAPIRFDAFRIRLTFDFKDRAMASAKAETEGLGAVRNAEQGIVEPRTRVETMTDSFAKATAKKDVALAAYNKARDQAHSFELQLEAIDAQLDQEPDDADLKTLRAQVDATWQPLHTVEVQAKAALDSADVELGGAQSRLDKAMADLETAEARHEQTVAALPALTAQKEADAASLVVVGDTLDKLAQRDLPFTLLQSNQLFAKNRHIVELFAAAFEAPLRLAEGIFARPGQTASVSWSEDGGLVIFKAFESFSTFDCQSHDGYCVGNGDRRLTILDDQRLLEFNARSLVVTNVWKRKVD
jgi:hypothetical protein